MENLNSSYIYQIRKCIESRFGKKIVWKETAKDIGISSATLVNFLKGKSNARVITIQKIMRYGGCMIKCKEQNIEKWKNCMKSHYCDNTTNH